MVVADKKAEALKIVEEGLKELESAKGSVAIAVQKLSRAARLINEDNIYIWTQLQLANPRYLELIEPFYREYNKQLEKEKDQQNFTKVSGLF